MSGADQRSELRAEVGDRVRGQVAGQADLSVRLAGADIGEQHTSGRPLFGQSLGRLLLRRGIRCRGCHHGTFSLRMTKRVGPEIPTPSGSRGCIRSPASGCRPGVVAEGLYVVMIAATGLRRSPATEVAKGQ